jgi:hypothetical protein
LFASARQALAAAAGVEEAALRQDEEGGAMAGPLRILIVLIGLGALLLTPRAAAQEPLIVEIAQQPGWSRAGRRLPCR